MTLKSPLLGSAAAIVLFGGAGGATAQDATGTVTPQFSTPLANAPGQVLTTVTVDYPPGGATPAHMHAGSVWAYVLKGSIRSKLDDGPSQVYHEGQSFFEPPGTHHVESANASTTEPARLLAVFVAPPGAVLTTPLK